MRKFLRVVGAVAIVTVSFFLTVIIMDLFAPLCPQREGVELKAPFPKFGTGFAYAAAVPSLEKFSDSNATPVRSSYLVCENNFALGPPHSVHVDIGAKGKGRFSHWTMVGFIFSASDNTDPNTNGRRYWVVSGSK
jgi:hypothetical protein